jgi:hypothetical protein
MYCASALFILCWLYVHECLALIAPYTSSILRVHFLSCVDCTYTSALHWLHRTRVDSLSCVNCSETITFIIVLHHCIKIINALNEWMNFLSIEIIALSLYLIIHVFFVWAFYLLKSLHCIIAFDNKCILRDKLLCTLFLIIRE